MSTRPTKGRPPFEPNDEQRKMVRSMVASGMNHEMILDIFNRHTTVSGSVFRKHFHHELTHGKREANREVADSLFKMATNGNVVAAIFWLKTQGGWRETDRLPQIKEVPPGTTVTVFSTDPAEAARTYLKLVGDTGES